MALVGYSDSEGSEDEKPQTKVDKPAPKPSSALPNANFAIDRANPRKIQVKLQDLPANGTGRDDGEPARKRPRVGGGAFSGFNAMLPAPKRESDNKSMAKPAARKVFSLKTGAEPGFSRESDAELRQLFAEQGAASGQKDERTTADDDDTIPSIPKKAPIEVKDSKDPPTRGNTFMFKPLSVARNNKKPKRKGDATKSAVPRSLDSAATATSNAMATPSRSMEDPEPAQQAKKVSLFSMGGEPEPVAHLQPQEDEDEIIEVLDEPFEDGMSSAPPPLPEANMYNQDPQSLDAIAADLNLSKADRRQLFGRRGQGGQAINVVNFNTDQEYAANEVLRASGEQVQHNPVRSIAPGKHSLKQLVSAATGQKDALEESFATGRRNKKEAGSKYGW